MERKVSKYQTVEFFPRHKSLGRMKTHTTGRDRHDDEDMYVPLQTAFEAGRCSGGVYVCVCVIVCVFVCVCTRTRLYM